MLACGHDREPVGTRVCAHLRARRESWLSYVKWYTGVGMETELLCNSCAAERQGGGKITVENICQGCFELAINEFAELDGVRGKPEVRVRAEALHSELREADLPKEIGNVTDASSVGDASRSLWLLLTEGSRIFRFDADTGDWRRLAEVSLALESDRKPWCGHELRRHLYASPCGDFAAVVNDYGRYGQIIDLRSGRVTAALDGGDYHVETVPFSFAFAKVGGRVVAVHRTAWNRLDVSDPSTGEVLTDRGPTSYQRGQDRPEHYLDYFHGALVASPNYLRIADDGWVWHPVGIPAAWTLGPWLFENSWESEDGPTRKLICGRDYYWGHALTWLDDHRVAIGGIGDDDLEIVDGARIFDITLPAEANASSAASRWCRELTAFPGPAGYFFSNGQSLFSADGGGLSRWDVVDGARTGFLPGFNPRFHHRGARELVQLSEEALIRWKIRDGE